MLSHDGHVHTPFCPHGTADTLAAYAEEARKKGLSGLTFTEHAPLPASFQDPVPGGDSAMHPDELFPYLEAVERIKQEYRGSLTILSGLEVDYIHGWEKETKALLQEAGPYLDDSILSVHFLQTDSRWHCIDFSREAFEAAALDAGGRGPLYHLYYETLLQAIQADLGPYKPARLGHITLIRKFQHAFDQQVDDTPRIREVLHHLAAAGMQLDANTAGRYKPECREMYPPETFVQEAAGMDIPVVYGSDAHRSDHTGADIQSVASLLD
ncbi:histidinol-phosphatase HisJ [Alkalicoccus chagannorensis]|uniref:histidinol-phosphatase HisJ n=1 Tax=Alkalicoccus chagannorensis TaxID=427072 RepID=UPI000411DEDC|nr:histidinol-phosphatase HisJ [Alkalicoccus chagannorensis]